MAFTSFSCMWDRTVGSLGFGYTEILIFVIAFSMHALFFGKYKVPGFKGKHGTKAKRFGDACPEQSKTNGRKSKQPPLGRSATNKDASTSLHDDNGDIAAIRAQLQTGTVKESLEALDVMYQAGACLNSAILNEFVEIAVKVSYDDAWAIVKRMRGFGVKPDRGTCSILLRSMRRKSSSADVSRTLALLEEIDGGPDEVLLNLVIEACINTGSFDILRAQLEKTRSSGTIQLKHPHSYGSLIRAYGHIGNLAGVWETWRSMHKNHVLPTSITLGCMVEALTTNGELDASYELVQELVQDSLCKSLVNSVIYGSLLKGFSHQKKFDRVWSIYQEMLGLNLQFSIVTFNTLLDACARSRDMARIPGLLQSMTEQGIEPNLITYGIVIKGYCQENKLQEALAIWESMVSTTKFQPDEIMYNTILDGCARKGMFERGMALLDDMQKAGIPPSNFTLSVLVKLSSRAGKVDRAFELAEDFSKKYRFRLNVHVFNNLIQACANHNDLPRAFEVLDRMVRERVRPDVRTYSLLTRACVAAGECQDAASLIRAAIGIQDELAESMKLPNLAKLQKGLPMELLMEVLDGMSEHRDCGMLALTLFKDLQRNANLKLPAQLQLRLAKQTISA